MEIISLDTNIFIYYFQENDQFGLHAKKIFQQITKRKKRGITSVITLIELLSFKMSEVDVNLIRESFLEIPNLTTFDINQEIGLEASRIRREYGFRSFDSLQLATALYGKADIFITNDVRLKKFKEINVEMIKDF